MKYGKYALISPVTHTFVEEPDLYWIIEPPTSGDELALSQFLQGDRVVLLPGGARVSHPAVNLEIAHREIALTFGGTNLIGDDGQPVLKKEATPEEVEVILRQMPHKMVMEIWYAIADCIPGWGPIQAPKAKVSDVENENAPKNSIMKEVMKAPVSTLPSSPNLNKTSPTPTTENLPVENPSTPS